MTHNLSLPEPLIYCTLSLAVRFSGYVSSLEFQEKQDSKFLKRNYSGIFELKTPYNKVIHGREHSPGGENA